MLWSNDETEEGMKRFLAVITVIVLFCGMAVIPAHAATVSVLQPRYTHVSVVQAALTIDESLGITTCYGRVDAKNFDPVKVIVRLQQFKNGYWTTLKSWSATGTMSAICSKQYAVYDGYRYRVSVTGYVYDSNGTILETASAIHEVNYPSN